MISNIVNLISVTGVVEHVDLVTELSKSRHAPKAMTLEDWQAIVCSQIVVQ
jgi:hypothetical protein